MTNKAGWFGVAITVLMTVVSAVSYVHGVDKRVDEVDARVSRVEISVQHNREIVERVETDLKGQLEKIDGKLDRLIRER